MSVRPGTTRPEGGYGDDVERDLGEPASAVSFDGTLGHVRSETVETRPAGHQDATGPPYVRSVRVSFAILFLELASIRWFGSTVIFLTFFTNLVLMACFLGMSVGLPGGFAQADLLRWVLPADARSTVALACVVLGVYLRLGRILIDVGGQGSPQQVFFGTEYQAQRPSQFVVPIEAVAGLFFGLIALMFVGLGQVLGPGLRRDPQSRRRVRGQHRREPCRDRRRSAVVSCLRGRRRWSGSRSAAALVLYLRDRCRRGQLACACAIVAVVAIVGLLRGHPRHAAVTIWSPYYKIKYKPRTGLIATNNIGHQTMVSLRDAGRGLPAAPPAEPRCRRQAVQRRPDHRRRLGQRRAAASARVPRTSTPSRSTRCSTGLGRRDHPDRPYDDPRVSVHLDDGRSFVRTTDRRTT